MTTKDAGCASPPPTFVQDDGGPDVVALLTHGTGAAGAGGRPTVPTTLTLSCIPAPDRYEPPAVAERDRRARHPVFLGPLLLLFAVPRLSLSRLLVGLLALGYSLVAAAPTRDDADALLGQLARLLQPPAAASRGAASPRLRS